MSARRLEFMAMELAALARQARRAARSPGDPMPAKVREDIDSARAVLRGLSMDDQARIEFLREQRAA